MRPTREERIRQLVDDFGMTEREATFAVAIADGGPGDVLDDSDEEPMTLIDEIDRAIARRREEAERRLDGEVPVRVA